MLLAEMTQAMLDATWVWMDGSVMDDRGWAWEVECGEEGRDAGVSTWW